MLGSFSQALNLSMPSTSPIRTNMVKREVFNLRANSCSPAVKYQQYNHVLLDRDASSSQAEAGILRNFLLLFFYRPFDFIRSFLKFPDREQTRSCPSWPLLKQSHAHERDFSGCGGRSPCIPVQAQDPEHHLYVLSVHPTEAEGTPQRGPGRGGPVDRTRWRGPCSLT